MSAPIENLKHDRDALIAELERAGARIVNARTFHCFHGEDRNPSGSIYQTDAGTWVARCHSCGESWDVWALKARNEGRPVETIMSEARQQAETRDSRPDTGKTGYGPGEGAKAPRRFANVEAVKASFGDRLAAAYAYTSPADGRVELLVIRTRDKGFFQFHQDAPGGEVISGAPPKPWPVYNRTRLIYASAVVVVEGEKDVHTLHEYGAIGTCSPGGAKNAANADWTPLAGKDVVLWPDFDEAGAQYAATVRAILETLTPPPSISIIDPALLSLGPKEDVSDFMAQFASESPEVRRGLLHEALSYADPIGPAADLTRQLADIAAGRRRAVHFMHAQASRLTQALLPGTITIVCGSLGASKSFWLQEVLMNLHAAGVTVALLHLEEDRTFHLRRVLAQLAGLSGLTDETWIAEHPQDALAAAERYAGEIQSFGVCITDTPAQGMNYEAVTAWAKDRAETGARVIAIDPITLADPGERRKQWDADRDLMAALKSIAVRRGASIMLVSHPSKGAPSSGNMLDSLAGGAAFQRAAQTVLWLEHLAAPMEDAIIHGASLTFRPDADEPVNRILHLSKARNGRGQGQKLAFHFDPKTLRSKELGVLEVISKRKGGRQ